MNENYLKVTSKIRKKIQFFQIFNVFMQVLSNLCLTSWFRKIQRVSKEQVWRTVGFPEELIAVFKLKKSKLAPNLRKNPQNFPIFKNFMQLLSKIRQTLRIGMLKTVVKVRICRAVVFYEKIITVFMLKNFQIGTEIDKKPKIFKLSMFLCSFCQLYDRLRGLEC